MLGRIKVGLKGSILYVKVNIIQRNANVMTALYFIANCLDCKWKGESRNSARDGSGCSFNSPPLPHPLCGREPPSDCTGTLFHTTVPSTCIACPDMLADRLSYRKFSNEKKKLNFIPQPIASFGVFVCFELEAYSRKHITRVYALLLLN